MKSLVVSLLAVSLLASPLAGSEGWLPDAVAEGLAQQLAERTTGVGLSDEGRALAEARETVSALRQELDAWKLDGVLEKAPRFSELEIPASGDPHLDAMRRYTLCNLVLLRTYLTPASREVPEAITTAVFGLTGLTMVIVRLREPYVQAGGTDAALEAALTAPELEPLVEAIQAEARLLEHVERQCRPVVQPLVTRARRE